MMVTIAWNPLGFYLFGALPKGNTFNIEYYRVNILTELLPLRPQVDGRRLVTHADNARPHTARKRRVSLRGKSVPPHRTPTVLT
jgi:hypothetical protein